jgi:hypothetical protein
MLKALEDTLYRSYMRAYLRCDEPDWLTMMRWRAFRIVACAHKGEWSALFSMRTLFPTVE